MTDLYQERHNWRSEMLYSSIRGGGIPFVKIITAYSLNCSLQNADMHGHELFMAMDENRDWKLNFSQAGNVSKPCSQDCMSVWYNDWTYNRMFGHSSVQTFKCSAVQTFSCSDVQLFRRSVEHRFRRSSVQLFIRSTVQAFRRSDVQLFRCSDGLTAYQSNKQSIVWMNNRSNDRSWTTFGYGWQSESKYKLFRKRLCFPNKRPSSELRK